MRHDLERVRAEIEKFHENPTEGDDPILDLDDFTLLHVFITPREHGPLVIEINRGDCECELQLVGAHSFVEPRAAVLEWARVFSPSDMWPDEDFRLDVAAIHLERELPSTLCRAGEERIIPPRGNDKHGRPLCMAFRCIVARVPLDLVLVFDRHPLPPIG